jgi:hypothetical protein
MVVSFFKHGTGGGGAAINYLLSEFVKERDPEGRYTGEIIARSVPPVVVAGEPGLTQDLIDASPNKWKYSSGAIAFERGDNPAEAEQREVMEDFERLAFAGLNKDQYNILWVRHEEKGNVELHFVCPRLELTTGKALNPRPPGPAATAAYDAFRDKWNHSKGWARPDDPARARLTKDEPTHGLPNLENRKTAKEAIDKWLMARIERSKGSINDRAGVVACLSELGEITREGKDYISVKPEGFDKALRLKGKLYDRQFNAGLCQEIAAENPARSGNRRGIDLEGAEAARDKLERAIQARAEFNLGNYRAKEQRRVIEAGHTDRELTSKNSESLRVLDIESDSFAIPEPERDSAIEQRAESLAHPATASFERTEQSELQDRRPELYEGAIDRPSPLSGYLSRELGTDSMVDPRSDGESGRPELRGSPDFTAGGDTEHVGDQNLGRKFGSGEGRNQIYRFTQREEGRELSSRIGRIRDQVIELIKKGKAGYDRVRNEIARSIEDVARRAGAAKQRFDGFMERARERLNPANKQLAAAGIPLDHAIAAAEQRQPEISRGVDQLAPKIERACRVMSENRADELEQFKRNINLAEYAASQGYVLDKSESSRNSRVMRKGDDKIVVATAEDGHGIYFSVRDGWDNGSIVDFIQKRQNKNLGQVRKELRPWMGSAPLPIPEHSRTTKPEPTTRDRAQVIATWAAAEPVNGHHSYLEKRGIKPETLADSRFSSVIRQDKRGNAVFPHYDKDGISGFELKNDEFTGFARGGEKALWFTPNIKHAKTLAITESAIDALSHAQLQKDDKDTAYLSIGGQPSPEQWGLIKYALERAHERGQLVAVATDNDRAGHGLAKRIGELAPEGAEIKQDVPRMGKDWNDQVQAMAKLEKRREQRLERGGPSLG